ncbi:MAG TPA: ATP-binding protein, partial [Thermoanaerobaculia bacterium]|nr:ATP-binding protein [Thermoanaerobaculia bacterium]
AAERTSDNEPAAHRGELSRWRERVDRLAPEGFRPAGDATDLSDLSRALWVRGADESFPDMGDVLQLRNESGEVVSAFGLVRPGVESRGVAERMSGLLAGLDATWIHVAYPREADRDPLLSAAVAKDLPDRVAIGRTRHDAAGRALPSEVEGRADLPGFLVDAARRKGLARGTSETPSGAYRFRVRATREGFTSLAAPCDSPLRPMSAALAAAETALLLFVPLLAVRGIRRPVRSPKERRVPFLGTFRARLVILVVLFGAVPLAGSILVIRLELERHAEAETAGRARSLLMEARRSLPFLGGTWPSPSALNEAASVLGNDLLLYRDGKLAAASRALPVAAEIARERLTKGVAESLAEGASEATGPDDRKGPGEPRVYEGALALSPDGRDALAVLIAEDEAGRAAVDTLVLFSVAVAFGAALLGSQAALALGKPIADLIAGAERLGSGAPAPRIERPGEGDLARLVEAFEEMAERVRERTESLGREREAAVALTSSLTSAAILFRDRDGAVLLSNPAADALLPGADMASRLSHEGWRPLRAILAEAAARRALYETRIAVGPPPHARVYRVAYAPLPPDGSDARSLLLLEDLTDFMRADRLSAWVEAARAIAHDIKNPLTPIRLSAERLLRSRGPVDDAQTASTAANILRQVAILTERTGRLARFADATPSAGKPLDRDALDRLLAEVAADYEAHPTVRVEAVRAPKTIPTVRAERDDLRDALTNFVVNAVEAIGDDGGHVRLSVADATLPDGRAGVRFLCEDDGPGVPEGEIGRLFTPAFSTKSRGSGMGLAAVRRAIERHGGTVMAASREPRGLVVGFTLPSEGSAPPLVSSSA